MSIVITGVSAPAVAAQAPSFITRQQIDAEVTSVNANATEIRLRTDAGRFTVHAVGKSAPKPGTAVVMDVTIIRHREPSAVPRAQDGPPPLALQRLRGSVVGIDRSAGIVAVNSAAGRLALGLPSDALRTLRTGDPLWLDIAVRPVPEVSASPRDSDTRQKKSVKTLLLMLLGRAK